MKKWFLFLLVLVFCVVAGCSAIKKVATAATRINTEATEIRSDVVLAKEALQNNDLPAVGEELDSIDGHAENIQAAVAVMQKELTQVQDKVPYWQNMVKWVAVSAAVLGCLFLLWRVNGLLLLERGIQGVITFVAKLLGAL